MITEKAQVIAVEGEHVLVQTARQSACNQCSVNKGCGSSVLARLVGARFMQMRLNNALGAKVGDTVEIGLRESGLIKSAFILYAWPLLSMPLFIALAALLVDQALTDGIAIFSALLGLGFGLITARMIANRLSHDSAFYPVILSIEKNTALKAKAVFAP